MTPTSSKHNYDGIDMGEGSLGFPKRLTSLTEEGRKWFARGWMHAIDFHHEAAIECFKSCIEVDGSNCAMAFYGIAYAVSSNYNFLPGLSSGFDPIQHALQMIQAEGSKYSELEVDLVEAMATRSSAESKAAMDPTHMNFGNTPELNLRFSEAMAKVNDKYPDDLDVMALYAESLMVLKPWALWAKKAETSDEIVPADGNTVVAKKVLERAMELPGGMEHPAILHLYVHLMELSGEPMAAMPAADVLRSRFPHAPHLTHMPSHIDMNCGHYKAAVDTNINAMVADKKTMEFTGMENCTYKSYRLHNMHLATWAAMFSGQADLAMKTAREMESILPPGDETSGVQFMLLGMIPMGAMMWEPYTLTKWHVMIRFGLWDDIIAEPLHENPALYPTAIATAHYARGIAFASQGLIAQAEEEQAIYVESMKSAALQGRMLHNNLLVSEDTPCLFKIGEAMLAGEIEYRKGNFDTAFEHLREAVRLDTGLPYDEPWGWMVPARHALGALLLEQGHIEEATQVFRADLKKHPGNMWGLLGLRQCLDKAGKGADSEALDLKESYDEAASLATTKPAATCFCAKAAGAASPTV